jgi:hypothetical protein
VIPAIPPCEPLRIGNRLAGIAVILILTFAIVFNVSKLPYAMWFKVVMLICFPVACYLGGMRGVQMSSPAADSNTEKPADLGEYS